MSADPLERFDLGVYLHRLAKELHRLRSFDQFPSQCPHRLIAYEADGTLLPPQVVLQMVPDPAGLTHAGGREDHLGLLVKIDHLGLIGGDGGAKPREDQRVDPLLHQGKRLLVKTRLYILIEHIGCLNGQRTVHIYFKILILGKQSLLLDLPEEIEKLLGPSYREGRDHQVAAPVEGLPQDPG